MRILARRDGAGVRLVTRHGNDFTRRFPLAVAALSALSSRSFLIDGEAIVTNADGLAVFDLIRRAHQGGKAVLCTFDLIELDSEDLRRSRVGARAASRCCAQPALRRRRRDHFSRGVSPWLRGYCVEAARLDSRTRKRLP
jgi:ATP dependent DNA ligase-like protein